ncbi:MAG: M20/M25/M40 family metallo-hydrolase [Actinobacteria bacterium]|nr:M20/M25/M40 family metallo-hydrolase [Actinomycetota bacterium]
MIERGSEPELDDVVGLTMALAGINSVNPGLMPGGAGETAVAEFVAEWMRERGFEVHCSEAAPGRPNVVGVRTGSGGGRSLLYNGHLDTVGSTGPETLRVFRADGRLHGRGVLDTKGGLAAAMIAAASIEPGELAGDVIIAAVADEELASVGTEALVREWVPDAAVVLEPTDLRVIRSHRGWVMVRADFQGRPSHTSRPDRGANAVHAAARAITALTDLSDSWLFRGDVSTRPLALANAVTSAGEPCTVPERCTLLAELRTVAPDEDEQVAAALDAIRSSKGDTTVDLEVTLHRRAMSIDLDHPFLADVLAVVGGEAEHGPYWTDAALHDAAGTPAVVLGPTGEGLHEHLEWVTEDSLYRLTEMLGDIARRWCVTPRGA